MKLKKNELKIIQLLLASPDYISTYDIATSTGIPRRLVRDEISNVRVILSSLNLIYYPSLQKVILSKESLLKI